MNDLSYHDALAMLDWQVELGADEAILDAAVDRFTLEDKPKPAAVPVSPVPMQAARTQAESPAIDGAERALAAAAGAADLPSLKAAMEAFEHCALKETALNLVFSDGNPAARVMIVGEAPGRDEDRQGKPFVGRAGQFLDRMVAAIGLDRASEDPAHALYITNMLPWRPPQNRDPTAEELSMLAPFVRRHIDLADPDVLILMGNSACQGLLGRRGITRMRGQWAEVMDRPAIPMFHPAYLLRKPQDKARAWADLLSLQAKLRVLT